MLSFDPIITLDAYTSYDAPGPASTDSYPILTEKALPNLMAGPPPRTTIEAPRKTSDTYIPEVSHLDPNDLQSKLLSGTDGSSPSYLP